jgi:hypothetical protein
MKVTNKGQAIILLLIMIAIGGIVLYGGSEPERLRVKGADKTYAPQ